MLSAGFLSRHESMCKKNPKNKHKCFQYCKFMEKHVEYTDTYISDGDEGISTKETTFTCTKLNKMLRSYKSNRNTVTRERYGHLELMPTKCEFYSVVEGKESYDMDYDFDEHIITEIPF